MNKDSESDESLAELFQILKDDAVKVLHSKKIKNKVLHSICQPIWKTRQWPQDWRRSVFIPVPKMGSAKESSKYHTVALDVMLAR